MKKKKSLNRNTLVSETIFDIVNVVFLGALCIAFIFPLFNVAAISLTSKQALMQNPLSFFPEEISFEAYNFIFSNKNFVSSISVTTFITVFGTIYSLILTAMMSYAFSCPHFPGKKILWNLVLFTMFFSGGTIPYYMIVKEMGLVNNIFSMILPIGIHMFNMLVIKSFFQEIPQSLREAATIDGANEFTICFKIILPLSKPVLATFSLYYAVFYWNQWWQGMLFIQKESLKPLQLFLRELLNSLDIDAMERQYLALANAGSADISSQSVKMATLFVATIPILMVYPFLQKHFAKGIMVGAVKG